MPPLSQYSRRRKLEFFVSRLPKEARILEIGSGDGWLSEHLKRNGWVHHLSVDVDRDADFVGDIRDWRGLGLRAESFDVVIAFEVVEHVPCFREAFDLLVPGGLLMLTSPVPSMDWACWMLEKLGLNQKRTSPHSHLIDFRRVPLFEPVQIRIVAGMAQWGIFRKPRLTGGAVDGASGP